MPLEVSSLAENRLRSRMTFVSSRMYFSRMARLMVETLTRSTCARSLMVMGCSG